MEARCNKCGQIYSFKTNEMPKSVRCFCESREFTERKADTLNLVQKNNQLKHKA